MKIPKSIAALALAMLTLGVTAQKAQAQIMNNSPYTCSNDPTNPINTPGERIGNVTITEPTGNCIITGPVWALGSLTINVTSSGGTMTAQSTLTAGLNLSVVAPGNILIQGLTETNSGTGGSIFLNSTNGSVTSQGLQTTATAGTVVGPGAVAISAPTAGSKITVNGVIQAGADVDLTGAAISTTGAISAAQNDIYLQATGNISVGGGLTSYGAGIVVHANYTASATTTTPEFAVGNGGTNGITGVVNANGVGTAIQGGIYITNGGTGGIAVAHGTDLTATSNSTFAPPVLILDACNESAQGNTSCTAPITIGSGKISTDGDATHPAGQQAYLARSITVTGTTLSAKDTAPASGHPEHSITLTAQTYTLKGAGLTITSTGATNPTLDSAVELDDQGAFTCKDNFAGPGSVITCTDTIEPANPVTVFGPGKLTINGSGAHAVVNVQGNPLTFDSSLGVVTITNNSATSTVNIHTETGALSFNEAAAFTVNANGTTGGSNAGSISISASQITSPVVPAITLTANGTTTHNGGSISITSFQSASNILLGTSAGQFALSATGGPTSGNGGSITVNADGGYLLFMTANAVLANAVQTSAGGTVELYGISQFNSSITSLAINSSGANSGAGGNVVISQLNQTTTGEQVDLNLYINVSAGILATSPSTFDGSMSVDNVLCQQWFTGFGAWPLSYWDCVNPTSPNATDQIQANVAKNIPDALTVSLLQSHNVNLFVFPSGIYEAEFFADSVTTGTNVGVTFRQPFTAGIPIESAVFEQCFNCLGSSTFISLTNAELAEDSAHELGHAIDFSTGTGLVSTDESQQSTYITYYYNDSINLDFDMIGATRAASHQRVSCSTNTQPGGVFDNIQARPQPQLAPVPMCVNVGMPTGELNPVLMIPPNTFNSTILQAYSGHTGTTGELYAQTFAYKDASTPGDYLDLTADSLFAQGTYYGCTLTRASQIWNGSGVIPSSCSNTVPAWYTMIVGH